MLESTCIWLLLLLLDKSHLRLWHCVCSCRLQKPNVIKLWLRPKSELLHLWYSNLLSLITCYREMTKRLFVTLPWARHCATCITYF